MQMRSKPIILLMLIALVLGSATAAMAAANFTISSTGNGVFTIQGSGLEGVAGIQLTVSYDTATLANPRAVQGSLIPGNFMTLFNTSVPGSVTMATITGDPKGVSGTGPIVTITFDLLGGSSGRIQALTATLFDSIEKPLAVTTNVYNPSDTQSTPTPTPATPTTPAPATSVTPTTITATSTVPAYLGGVTMPAEGAPAKEKAKEEPGHPPLGPEPGREESSRAAAASEPARQAPESQPLEAPAEKKFVAYKSVLERFREFKGDKTPKSLIALFETAALKGIRQEPAIALADGTTKVNVFIELTTKGREAPNFVLKGAKIISLKMAGENSWVIEALPIKRVYEATITVLHNGSVTEIPLTVAPPMDANIVSAGDLTEANFIHFLKERGTAKVPAFDLNHDGKRDYIDEYIFTANYLVKRGVTKKKGTAKKL